MRNIPTVKRKIQRLVTQAGIYHNPSLGLISLSSDGESWITIADKNLGATEVWNEWDGLTNGNCGNYYQWWNNYWFPWPEWPNPTTSNVKVDATWYWPWNYYSSDIFRTKLNFNDLDRSSVSNDNLWWDVTNTLESRKWPCEEWFHIPTKLEFDNMWNIFSSFWITTATDISRYLNSPLCWDIYSVNGIARNIGECWYFYSSSCFSTSTWNFTYVFCFETWEEESDDGITYQDEWFISSTWKISGYSIRPFKNTPVIPDSTRTVLYQPNQPMLTQKKTKAIMLWDTPVKRVMFRDKQIWPELWPAPTNLVWVAGTLKATLTWTSATGESWVTWTEERLVRKEWSAPQWSMDWTTVATIPTKDTYATNWYEDTGLDNTKTYYYKVFAIYDNWTEKGSSDVNVTPDAPDFAKWFIIESRARVTTSSWWRALNNEIYDWSVVNSNNKYYFGFSSYDNYWYEYKITLTWWNIGENSGMSISWDGTTFNEYRCKYVNDTWAWEVSARDTLDTGSAKWERSGITDSLIIANPVFAWWDWNSDYRNAEFSRVRIKDYAWTLIKEFTFEGSTPPSWLKIVDNRTGNVVSWWYTMSGGTIKFSSWYYRMVFDPNA